MHQSWLEFKLKAPLISATSRRNEPKKLESSFGNWTLAMTINEVVSIKKKNETPFRNFHKKNENMKLFEKKCNLIFKFETSN